MRIGTTILLKNGVPVQSHQFSYYTGLGDFSRLVRGITAKKIDEIAIINIDRSNISVSAKKTYGQVEKLNSDTPILYGGGFRYLAPELITSTNVERFIISSQLIEEDFGEIRKFAKLRGLQSVVGCVPVWHMQSNYIEVLHCDTNKLMRINRGTLNNFYQFVDELILIDCQNFGKASGYNWSIVDCIQKDHISKTIITGGITAGDISIAKTKRLAAVYLDNIFLHKVECRDDYEY